MWTIYFIIPKAICSLIHFACSRIQLALLLHLIYLIVLYMCHVCSITSHSLINKSCASLRTYIYILLFHVWAFSLVTQLRAKPTALPFRWERQGITSVLMSPVFLFLLLLSFFFIWLHGVPFSFSVSGIPPSPTGTHKMLLERGNKPHNAYTHLLTYSAHAAW